MTFRGTAELSQGLIIAAASKLLESVPGRTFHTLGRVIMELTERHCKSARARQTERQTLVLQAGGVGIGG